MTIEQSHGKARPTLPRASDLPRVESDTQRSPKRDEKGRFLPGNSDATGRGWKVAIAKVIGKDAGDEVALTVARDAWRLYSACIREMPSDGPTVRGLVAQKARHEALAAFWHAKSVEYGLDTEQGIRAQDQASKNAQRAERITVTAIDVAVKLAGSQKRKNDEVPPWLVEVQETTPVAPQEAPKNASQEGHEQ